MLRAFLFDFDGTIVDTEPLHYASFVEVLAKRGITLAREDYFERYLSLTDRECLERLIEVTGRSDLRPEIDRLFAEKVEAMSRRLVDDLRVFPGAAEFIAEASTIGPLAIVSGALRREVDDCLERAGLARHFTALVAAEDVRFGKPNPEGYRMGWQGLRREALQDLEPAECLAIEDSPKGILAAREAGLRVLGLAHSRPIAALDGADRVVASYGELRWDELWSMFQ